jgi:hypothetical protein
MELGHGEAAEEVFDPGQGDVGDELVFGHAAFEGVAPVDHARTDDHVGFVLHERPEEVGEHFRGVLAIAMEHDDGIEAAVDGVLVAELLVAAVAAVDAVAEDDQLAVGVGIRPWPCGWCHPCCSRPPRRRPPLRARFPRGCAGAFPG